jgi:hypothetical protein
MPDHCLVVDLAQMKTRFTWSLILSLCAALLSCSKEPGVTPVTPVHVISHDNQLVVTDPSKGSNSYLSWTTFPDSSVDYRNVILWVTYACPDSLHCGEWDYIDNVFIRRTGGETGESKSIEIARMISPYGWRFDSEWKFSWHTDITDFGFLLHDSVEVEFRHGGYESNEDRGWLITLDFELVEGQPAVRVLGLDSLWCGSFRYGDSTKPIDSALRKYQVNATGKTDLLRLRILQTGHGMDSKETCAEFCDKYRRVLFDDSLVDQRQVWRQCGTNPLFPQAGTWIFDRANWCPGSIVKPDIYDFIVDPESRHTLKIDMEPYVNPDDPSAIYSIGTYLLYCKAPVAKNDVSMDEIIAPSDLDEYSRLNPICCDPTIRIKNSGLDTLKSVKVIYGLDGQAEDTYTWSGSLPSQKSLDITLPGELDFVGNPQSFYARLEQPNGSRDEYPADNMKTSVAFAPPVYDSLLVLSFRSNNDSLQNSYCLTDCAGDTVASLYLGSIKPATNHRITWDLLDGCYKFVFADTVGDGLDFWFNPEGGYGYVRLLDADGMLVRSFDSDFGSEIRHSFRVSEKLPNSELDPNVPIARVFPPRNEGTFELYVFFNDAQDLTIRVIGTDSTSAVYEQSYKNIKESAIPVDISGSPDGVYTVQAISASDTVSSRIRLKRE